MQRRYVPRLWALALVCTGCSFDFARPTADGPSKRDAGEPKDAAKPPPDTVADVPVDVSVDPQPDLEPSPDSSVDTVDPWTLDGSSLPTDQAVTVKALPSCSTPLKVGGGGGGCVDPDAGLQVSAPSDGGGWQAVCPGTSTHSPICVGGLTVARHDKQLPKPNMTVKLGCPAGKPVGGGCRCAAGSLQDTFLDVDETWSCVCNQPGTHQAFVFCIPNAQARAVGRVVNRNTAASMQTTGLKVRCPIDGGTPKRYVGGGCRDALGGALKASYGESAANYLWRCETTAKTEIEGVVICIDLEPPK